MRGLAAFLCVLLPRLAHADAPEVAVVSVGTSEVSLAAADRVAIDLQARGTRIAPDPDRRLRGPLEAPARPSARADQSARRAYNQAREAYTRFAFADARDHLERFDRAASALDPRAERDRGLIADRYLLSGLIHLGEERTERATRDFRAARRITPDRGELDPGRYRPQVVELYARAGDGNAEQVAVVIEVEAEGAAVLVDGERQRPGRLQVGAGPHVVVVRAPGHVEVARLVVATEQARWRFALEPLGPDSIWHERRRRAGDRSSALAALARDVEQEAGARSVVVTRSRRGRPVAAVYIAGKRKSEWLPAPSERLYAAIDGRGAQGSDLGLASSSRTRDAEGAPWYRRWWGKGLLVGGGAIVAGAVVYSVLRPEPSEPEVGLGNWCLEGESCAR